MQVTGGEGLVHNITSILWALAVDWVISEVLCVKQGGHGGRARYILKDALKYMPLYGWYLGYVSSGVYLIQISTSGQK